MGVITITRTNILNEMAALGLRNFCRNIGFLTVGHLEALYGQ